MKRALAARAKHDPNGLAPPVPVPVVIGGVGGVAVPGLSSPPPEPPLKIPRLEPKREREEAPILPESAPLLRTMPLPMKPQTMPIHISSSQPQTSRQALATETNSVPTSTPKPTNNQGTTVPTVGGTTVPTVTVPTVTTKTKQSMKRQRSSQAAADDDDDTEKSAFFLKHQNAALASELQLLRYQLQLLEKERHFRRTQCQEASQALHSLEATWNAMEVALQLGQQPQDDHTNEEEPEGTNSLTKDTPRSTGTGESVELIGALLDSLAAIAKEPSPVEGSNEEKQLRDIQRTADTVSKRATALQRWIWGLLRKVTAEDESGKHPLFKLAKLEAKLSALKAQVRGFQTQIAELAKCRDDAVESERKVRRGLYRLNAGRMKLEEVISAIETDGKDGSTALMALEENALAPKVEPSNNEDDEDVVDSAQIAHLRKQIRDLEEISASREKQIDSLTKQREENQKRINELALPSESENTPNEKVLSEDDIKSSELYTDAWTRMTTTERQLGEVQTKLEQTKENWAQARGDAEHATRSLEEHLMKHKKRWAELTDTVETENGDDEDALVKPETLMQAEMIAELEHKLKQALENVRRADVVRTSLEEVSQMNNALQSRLEDLKAKNAVLVAGAKPPARPETPSVKEGVAQEKPPATPETPNADRLHKEHRRMRKDLAAALQSKENAKARLEKSEKDRDSLIKANSRLAKQSAEKDEMNAKSLSTILHLKSVTEKLSQEKELFEQQVKSAGQVNVAARLAANAKERITDEAFSQQKSFEEKITLLEQDCEKVKAEYENATGTLAQKKAEMADLEKDASTAKERCDELVAESTKQDAEKRKILESLAIAQREAGDAAKNIAKMRSKSGGGHSVFTTDQLTTQISVLKNRLACPVCNHRDKSCIVLRCRHMFCRHCMDESIKNRNRKCPSCGQRFDTKDVEDIWL